MKYKTGYAKKLFGLGVTSCADFLNLAYRIKTLSEKDIAYVSSTTSVWPRKATLVVVDGIKQLVKFAEVVNSKQVVVVSDVPVLIRSLSFVEALDYEMEVSFCFNFRPVNIKAVRLALVKTDGEVEVRIRSLNQLGYVIDSLKKTDAMVSLFVATMASVDFTGRGKINNAFVDMCNAAKYDPTKLIASIEAIKNEYNANEVAAFVLQFKKSGKDYYEAIRSDLDAKAAAIKHDIDPYGVSYFRKKIRALGIANKRIAA